MPMVEVLGYNQVRSKMSQKRAATLAMLGETYPQFDERVRLERQGGAAFKEPDLTPKEQFERFQEAAKEHEIEKRLPDRRGI